MALAGGDDEVNPLSPTPDVSAAKLTRPSIPRAYQISKYTTYFVPLKQSNRLVGIAGGKDVVAIYSSLRWLQPVVFAQAVWMVAKCQDASPVIDLTLIAVAVIALGIVVAPRRGASRTRIAPRE
jgi:hypothetical protein